jgi:APA family basic amino acid/polyamine antiporter
MSETAMESDSSGQPRLALRRRLGLPLLVLYGVGITVGAGIYVLIGAVAGHAGAYSPWAFLLAGIVMAFTVASYAELSTRFPVSAGEAAYVKAAFNSRLLSTAIGLSTIAIGVMSASTVTLGSVGYIQQFVDLPRGLLVVIVVVVLGAVAAWGILESVVIAGLLTLVEVGGLLAIVVAAAHSNLPVAQALTTLPPLEFHVLSSIAFASLLAFFAFIGFEDLANIVEEAKNPHRDIPRAMVFTLIISTALYVIVAAVAISAVSVERLSSSPAPLSLVFREIAGVSPATISAIAIVATLNTILAQITMAARVVYGMARQGDLPAMIGAVHPGTATPWLATALIVAAVVGLALAFPFVGLAESTSVATLAVFAVVNLALLRLKTRRVPSSAAHVNIPIWMPAAGLVSCVVMIVAALSG